LAVPFSQAAITPGAEIVIQPRTDLPAICKHGTMLVTPPAEVLSFMECDMRVAAYEGIPPPRYRRTGINAPKETSKDEIAYR
jgi:hypothetical protein